MNGRQVAAGTQPLISFAIANPIGLSAGVSIRNLNMRMRQA
jgi:hypothetical protein